MEDITTTLRQGAEQVLDERQKKAQQYTFLNEALFKIKNPEYTSPYENIGQKTTRLFNKQEIQDIYDTLNPMYQSLADYGNPNDEQKKEMAAVKLASVFGTDYESAKKLTNIYYPMYAERDLREKGYGTRLWNAIESSFYNDMIGYNSTIATLFGSEEAKKRADDYYEKMMKVRNWQDFGAVGNFFIDNMQGIYSMGKMALITALTSGMGTALGASTKALSIVSGAINTIDSGATQMGSNVYMMSKMTDDNGKPLFDFENITPSERVLFGISAGLMGAIETVEFETLGKVLPKSIRNSIATAKATKLMNEAFLKTITLNGAKTTALEFAKNVGSNVLGEGLEEVLQQYVGNAFEVIEADIQNSRGANFGEDYSLDKHINEGIWESFWGGLEGSVLASLLSVGTGTFLNNKAIAQAQKKLGNYQTKTETSHTTYNDFIKNTDDFNFTQEEIIKRAEDIKQGKAEPIKTYKAENFGLYTDTDGALTLKALQTIDPSLNIVEAEIVESEVHDISTEAKKGRFATQFGGGLYKEDPNSFYFDNAEDLESAKQKIKNIKGLKLNDNILTVDTPNGEQTFNLKTIEEIEQARAKEREQAQQEYLEEEINPQLRKYMSFTDEEFKKVDNYIKENNISKNEKETEALKSFLGQIYRITKKGKNASVDNFLNSINIITEDNANLRASIDITTEANENGYRQATIHLTKDSTFASITHELNHYLQNNADIEDLRGFEEAYNIDLSNREVWNEQVSDELKEKRKIKNKDYTYAELFANDATKYYTQGTAENKEMANFFSKMKKALKKLVDFAIAKFLNKKTIKAFDKLFNNSKEYTQTESNNIINKSNSNGIITYYETEENPNNFIHTKEDIENIKNKDWILPPREEIKELDEDTAFIYNTIDLQKANGLDLINEARKIREDYELTQEGESDINGILTDEELQEINRANEERIANGFEADVEHELFKIFKNRMLDKVDNLPNNFNEVLDYAWKLADIKTEAEKDTEFVYKYATDYDGLLTLIKVLNKANKIIDKGRMIHLYNEYQGVADDILQLRRNSPKAKLKEALATIQSDPRSYRIAFEDASDLLYKGVDDALGKRDYYRTIKSELLDYLGKKEEEASEDLTEEEVETKANENLSNLRNIANLKGIPNDLKEPLKRSQARLKQLQHELEKANKKDKKTIDRLQEEIKDQEAKTEKLRQKIADYLTSQQIGKELKKAIKLSNFSDKTHSLKGASEFYWVKLKFLDEEGTNGYNTDLSNLARVNKIFNTNINLNEPSELMKYLLKRNNLEKEELETLQDFKNLNSLLRDLRRLARLQFKADENKRRNSIFELRKRAYNEAYGKNGTQSKGEDFTMSFFDKGAVNELNKKINSIESIEEKEDFLTKVRKETDKLFLATAHPAQIARYIDKTTNGTWQAIIENLNRSEEALQSSKNERYRNIQKSIENLMGFEAKHLLHDKGKEEAYLAQKTNEKGEKFIVKLNNGAIKELTRNEALMIYGYAIQDKGMACLTSEIGNNFTKDSVINLCNNLISDRDKQLVNLLSQDLSSKDLTIARIYARQNNKIYDTLENYFPLYASQGSFQSLGADSSGVGLRTTLHNDSNYVNKNFTKERTSVVYALKLDLWNNYIKGVERQEKYIYQSDWVRDAQNWISPRGMGTFLTREKGQLWTTTIKNLINDIAEPQRKVNELNGFMSRAFSNIVTANLMFNTVSAIKQVGAWFAVFTDPDFNLFSFAKAIADLTFRHKETVNNILQSNPDIDLQKGKGLDINESFEKNQEKRALGTFKEWGLKMADFMDLQGRYVVWQSAYQSYIDKHGITDNKGKLDISKNFEAIRKANRIVEETQNSTKRSQLASIQTKVSFLGSDKLAYSNSTFQYLNKFYDAIHLAKNKDYKGVLGHLSLLLFNGAFMTLLSGVLFRPSEKDKEKEDKRKKQMVKDLLSDFFEGFIPGWNELSPFFGGYQYNNSSVYSIADLPRKIIKVVEDCRDKAETKKVIADVMSASAEISKPLFSTPQIMVDRIAKGINDKDSTTLDKATINVLINLILGTGFYNNIKGR